LTIHDTSRMVPAIESLVAILAARPALSKVDVVDGPPLDWDELKLPVPQLGDGKRFLFIGASPGDDDTAAEGAQDFNAAGAVSRDETFAIICSALGIDGGGDMKVARGYASALVAEVEQTIRSDVTIGDTVLYSRLSTVDRLDQEQNSRGASVTFVFRIAARAYLS
jgi:hypothetical protein